MESSRGRCWGVCTMRLCAFSIVLLGLCCEGGGNPPSVPVLHLPPPPHRRPPPPPSKPPPHRRPPPPPPKPPPRPSLSFNFRATVTTEGYSAVNDRAPTRHHNQADWWIDNTVLGIRKTYSDAKAGKNITHIKLVRPNSEYSMRPFFNETACYKFPLNKPAGSNEDIFHEIVSTSLYGGSYKYWNQTVYKGLVHAAGCPAAGCQHWAYYKEEALDEVPPPPVKPPPPPHKRPPPPPHKKPPPPPPHKINPPRRREWGAFWLDGAMPVMIEVTSVTTEHQNNNTYTSTMNSTTKFTCGLPSRVGCGKPTAADFKPTASCADMVGPGGPTKKNSSDSEGWRRYLPETVGWVDGFRHHLPPEMGSDPIYSPTITPSHLLEAVNSPLRIAEVNADEDLGWRAAAIPRWQELSRLDTLPMLRARLSILPSLDVKLPATRPLRRLQPAGSEQIDTDNVTIPREFDARKNWPSCISIGTLRNQGNCGACYAMAAVEVLEDRLCIQGSYPHTLGKLGATDSSTGTEANAAAPMCSSASSADSRRLDLHSSKCLSAEYLISCDVHDSGCDGGYIDNAWRFLNTNGVPSEACDPYRHCKYPQLKNCTEPNATAVLSRPGDAFVPPSFLDSSHQAAQQEGVRVLLCCPDPAATIL